MSHHDSTDYALLNFSMRRWGGSGASKFGFTLASISSLVLSSEGKLAGTAWPEP